MAFWVNPADLNANNGFFMKGDHQVSVKTTNTGLEAFCYVNGWTPIVDLPCAQIGFEANEWNHVALSYDGNTLKLYVDGVLVGTDTVAGTVNSTDYDLGIGLNNDPAKASVKLRGQMDGVHVFSTILTDDQVAQLAAGTGTAAPEDDNIVMWYDADGYASVVEITGVTLDKSEAEIQIGEELVLNATLIPENATDKSLTWTSDKESVATVSGGKVTGISEGTATINGTAANGMSASCVVTVKAAHTHTPGEAVKENEKAPTCTEDGSYDSVVYCAGCGEEISRETVTVPAPGHSWKGTKCGNCDATRINPFIDVPEDSFYIDPVLWAVEEGITTGATATTFDPNGKCLRASVVTFLWRAAGEPEPTSSNNPFVDVKNTDFFYKAVLWAVEKGITNGTSATAFSPYAECNRAQVVTFLYRAQGNPEVTATGHPFTDVSEDQFYFVPMLWAVEKGITNGLTATTFGPTAIRNQA